MHGSSSVTVQISLVVVHNIDGHTRFVEQRKLALKDCSARLALRKVHMAK